MGGPPRQLRLKSFLLAPHPPPLQQLRNQQDSTSLLPGIGGELEQVEGHCYCDWSSKQRDKGPGRVLLREQGRQKGVGQSGLLGQAYPSGMRLVQG